MDDKAEKEAAASKGGAKAEPSTAAKKAAPRQAKPAPAKAPEPEPAEAQEEPGDNDMFG